MERVTGTLKYKGRPPQHVVDVKRAARMERVDNLPPDWRSLVHEYGNTVVEAVRDCGVREVRHAKHIIETILNELSPIRGSFSSQGTRQWQGNQLVLISKEPTDAMIEASMETVSTFDMTITKREKHRLRLCAAIAAATGRKRRRT